MSFGKLDMVRLGQAHKLLIMRKNTADSRKVGRWCFSPGSPLGKKGTPHHDDRICDVTTYTTECNTPLLSAIMGESAERMSGGRTDTLPASCTQ